MARTESGPPGRPSSQRTDNPGRGDNRPTPADLWVHPRGPETVGGPYGTGRQRRRRLDGHGHAGGRAVRSVTTPLRLLPTALCPGDQPAARRHPGRTDHGGMHHSGGRGQPARSPPRELSPSPPASSRPNRRSDGRPDRNRWTWRPRWLHVAGTRRSLRGEPR